MKEQAGAELCQAQAQVSFLAEAKLNLKVEFQIWVLPFHYTLLISSY
jgi:hypothetical protein